MCCRCVVGVYVVCGKSEVIECLCCGGCVLEVDDMCGVSVCVCDCVLDVCVLSECVLSVCVISVISVLSVCLMCS